MNSAKSTRTQFTIAKKIEVLDLVNDGKARTEICREFFFPDICSHVVWLRFQCLSYFFHMINVLGCRGAVRPYRPFALQ